MKISPHLTLEELACKDGAAYPFTDDRLYRLASVFEKIRALYGMPIRILSAYRTASWNKKIGGAQFSQHLEGKALDLRPPAGVTVENFYTAIRFHCKEFGIKGLGKYKTFVHVDIRDTDNLVAWTGTGSKDSNT